MIRKLFRCKPRSDNKNKENEVTALETHIRVKKIKHLKFIVDGKLYDTEKANPLVITDNRRILFVTRKGNYFSCGIMYDHYSGVDEKMNYQEIYETSFFDLRVETEEYAKYNIGKNDYDMYVKMFGEVEEA